ncbi:MAG: hypothetical protein CVT48_02480 [Thermoplasmata archaeon HGW-Thermoplasmata-1]|nr:MAG: hypothetical protein CVT48_02480 [Thermoplasmata archaeon HGW-Thermoplasmata-1]
MKIGKIAKYRIISQAIFFVVANLGFIIGMTGIVYPFFYCYASPGACASCPLGIIEHSVSGGMLMAGMFLYVIFFIALVGLVFGRAACGWACPIGALQDAINAVAGKLQTRLNNRAAAVLPSRLPGKMKYVKYGLLAYVVLGSAVLALPTFTDLCPVGVLTGTFPQLALNPGSFAFGQYFAVGMIIFSLFVALIVLVGRGWCRWFCPIGAMFAGTNKISILKLRLRGDKCVNCNACSKSCPMAINVPEDAERNPECILCGRCVDACKFDALRM